MKTNRIRLDRSPSRAAASLRGMTLTELLVVLAILSLLSTILLPTVVNKVEDARVATARQETKALAQAEEQCAAMHGFYVPLQVLDDLNPNVFGGAINPNSNVNADILSNEPEGNIYIIDPHRDLFRQTSSTDPALGGQATLAYRSVAPRIESMYQYWGGPFIEFHRYNRPNTGSTVDPSSTDVRRDYPLDPWGQPYRFFSPYGVIGGNGARSIVPSSWNDDSAFSGRLRNDGTSYYDRFAIVSFGPDNLSEASSQPPGDRASRNDDIVYTFGGIFSESSFRAFY